MRGFLGMILAAFVLSGCATQTAYKPAERRGAEGYTETKLSEGRYRITFIGNSMTPKDTVSDYALLRAAEVTLQEGYDWFRLAGKNNDQKVRRSTVVGAGIADAPQTTVYQRCGLVRCNTTAVVTNPGFDTGVAVAEDTSATEYSSSLEIVMGKKPMPNNVESYDARQLATTLRRYVPAQ